jgi:ankyrin repeat protein
VQTGFWFDAVQAGNGVVVSALLATGATAQVRLQDAAGDTPLVLAGRNGHAQVRRLRV